MPATDTSFTSIEKASIRRCSAEAKCDCRSSSSAAGTDTAIALAARPKAAVTCDHDNPVRIESRMTCKAKPAISS